MPNESSRRAERGKSGCAVEAALDIIGGRWKGVVIYWLLQDKRRFGELARLLPRCSARILSLQLRELEEDGLVTRRVLARVPPYVEYELTPAGRSLAPVIHCLREWGHLYQRGFS